MQGDRLRDDRRGVSITVSHVLTIAITAVLISGLIIAATGALTGQRERAARSQLDTVGQRLAFEVEQVDSLAARGNDTAAALNTDHTNWIVNSRYEVTLANDADCDTASGAGTDTCLVLTVSGLETRTVVGIDVSAPITESTAPGGEVRIVYDGTLKLEEQP
jgi:1-aminocyclopropane-1-carboxylate deaminase/D-cysteine desulfhydrase-like pyridoxal-dependent ACC family enzyme